MAVDYVEIKRRVELARRDLIRNAPYKKWNDEYTEYVYYLPTHSSHSTKLENYLQDCRDDQLVKPGSQYIPPDKRKLTDKTKKEICDFLWKAIEENERKITGFKDIQSGILNILRSAWCRKDYKEIVENNERVRKKWDLVYHKCYCYVQETLDEILTGQHESPIQKLRELNELAFIDKFL